MTQPTTVTVEATEFAALRARAAIADRFGPTLERFDETIREQAAKVEAWDRVAAEFGDGRGTQAGVYWCVSAEVSRLKEMNEQKGAA